MQAQRFIVKYITVQNCFIYLPDTCERQFTNSNKVFKSILKSYETSIVIHCWTHCFPLLDASEILKITHKNRDLYFSWQSRPSPDNFIRISATFARALGIQEDDDVLVSSDVNPGSVARVVVVPRNSQDLEIVELQSNKIQESLLNQINIVAVNQQIVVWISKFLSVVLTVESSEPNYKYGKLEMFTEIEVSVPKNIKNTENTEEIESPKSSVWNMFKNFVPDILSKVSGDKEIEKVEESVENVLKKFSKTDIAQTFRVLPLKCIEEIDSMSTLDSLLNQPYNAFIHERFLPRNFIQGTEISKEFYCRIKRVKENIQFVNKVSNSNFLRSVNTEGLNLATEIIVRLFVIEDILKKSSNNVQKEYFNDNSVHQSIYVSENLRVNLKLKIGGRVMLELIEYSEQSFTAVEIFPENDSVSEKDLRDYIQRQSKYDKILINSSAKIILSKEKSCVVRFLPSETSHALIDSYDLKNNIPIHFKNVLSNLDNQIEGFDESEKISLDSISIRGLKPVLSECDSVLSLSLGLDKSFNFNYDRENILICGKVGSGKTTVCKILRKTYADVRNFVYFNVIDCKALKGKKVETLHKTFLPAILDCVHHQPSVLIIDDLESIAGKTLDEEENTPDSINAARIADMLLNVITEYQAVHYVSVIATCTNVNKISQKLAAPRGVHLFRTILSIPDFEKEGRVEILQLALKSKLEVSNDVNWNHYGNKTEGWMPQDLINFGEKAVFTAWKRHVKSGSKSSVILSDQDLSQSLENSIPMSLQGIDLYSGPGHAWSDIGGLSEAKESLIELLHWPLKYPELFKNAPIKHQGGVLLYGAPGTGKTMLAGAIAKECGLSFISVKGPELLSKYIGASEEAVRNVFEKANSAKPCVLFFDEFDSLAPRRGHDSTGVTDRVVNQFLAQLDGVEGRQGVAVVAASSRPDLLDPALLRPGRLDKALLCPLPNELEREEILEALCRSQKLDLSLLDLKNLAIQTTGFTGADLNSIISQGRLSAIEENFATMRASGKKSSGSMNESVVTQKHLIDALALTRPSLSLSEMSKYDRIYAKFSRAEEFSDDNILKNNQRATLA